MPQLDLSHMKSKKAICCLCIAEIVLCTFAFVVIFSLSHSVCVCVFGVRFGTFSSSLNRFFFLHSVCTLYRFGQVYLNLCHTHTHLLTQRDTRTQQKYLSILCLTRAFETTRWIAKIKNGNSVYMYYYTISRQSSSSGNVRPTFREYSTAEAYESIDRHKSEKPMTYIRKTINKPSESWCYFEPMNPLRRASEFNGKFTSLV